MTTENLSTNPSLHEDPLDLPRQVGLLGVRDWRVADAARRVLLEAGQAGLQAVIQGLAHSSPRVRRACAQFLDHNGSDPCAEALLHEARRDPVPAVRRFAVHSLSCQRCKLSPLTVDGVAALIESAFSDPSISVRREAVAGLSQQPPDPRAAAALRTTLREEADSRLLWLARYALKHHDPEYRREMIEQAKARSLAAYEASRG